MESAIFIVPVVNSNPVVPEEIYTGEEGSGYSCIGNVPNAPTCIVRMWTDQAVIDWMAAGDDYLLVEQL